MRALASALACAAIVAAALVAAVATDRSVVAEVRARAVDELGRLAALRGAHVAAWREERLDDVAVFAGSPSVRAIADGDASGADHAREHLARAARQYGYLNLAVVLAPGDIVFALHGTPRLDDDDRALLRRAAGAERPIFSEVEPDPDGGSVMIEVAAPVPGRAGAVVLLRVDPQRGLFNGLDAGLTGLPVRTLLVRRDGATAAAIAPAERDDPPRLTSIPIERSDRPAVQAALGAVGALRGSGDHGQRVVASAAPVPHSPWSIVTELDERDIDAPARRLRPVLLAGILGLALASAALVLVLWQRQRIRELAARRILERRSAAAERAAADGERLLAALHDAVIRTDAAGHIVTWNQAAEALYGWTAGEVSGRSIDDLLGGLTTAARQDLVREIAERGFAERILLDHRKDGSAVVVETRSVAVRDEAGRLAGIVSVNRDVTERHRAERALRESEERLQRILEATDASVWEFDLATREKHPTSRHTSAFGDPGAVPSLDAALARVHPDDAARVEDAMGRHLAGETALYEAEFRVRTPAGEWRWVHARGKAVRADDGHPLRLAGTAVDVTEHHHLREQLVLSERMASLGTLAAGTAHEINNPLSFITANLSFAQEELGKAFDLALAGETAELEPLRRELADALAEARDGAERVRVIVRDLRAFSRGDDGVRAPVDLAHVVRGAARIAHREIEERARLAVDVDGAPPVLGNAAPLGQVVLNLLVNAAQAVEPGAPDRNEVRIAARADGDARVALTVSDTGCGIPPSVLPRIFDPFFTTKAPGEGTGLGLAICHALVGGMGGEIRVQSEPGRGATFTVLLPRAPGGHARSNTSTSATPLAPPATSTAASPSTAAPSPARIA